MKQYVVDAFTDQVFGGNPAAICICEEWPSEELMLNITKENNLSETAFAVKEGEHYHLRWFTPGGEIDLCGHATLACGFVIFNFIEPELEKVIFDTLSGELVVEKKDDFLEMDFPAYTLTKTEITEEIIDAIGATPSEAYMGRDLLCVFDNADVVKGLHPDTEKVRQLDGLLLQVTSPGSEDSGFDCVSRTFGPKCGIAEDPVCGSGHCHITPYWTDRLNKTSITACQASPRGGVLYCSKVGDRVKLGGKAALYSVAELYV